MKFIQVVVNLFQFNRTNWKAVALCFIAASVFWLFNSFNKNYSTNITFPLQFEFDQSDFVEVAPLPSKIQINVTGNGWELFRKYMGIGIPRLTVPIDRPAEVKKMVSSSLVPILSGQLGSLQINYLLIDTLRLQFDERYSRTFRLQLDESSITYRTGKGRISPVRINPDTVVMTGARSILQQWPDTLLLPMPVSNLSESMEEEVEVPLFGYEGVNRNPPVVAVRFRVGPVVILPFTIKLNVHRLPEQKVSAPDSVKAQIQIPEDTNRQLLTNISATVDIKRLFKGEHLLLPEVKVPDPFRLVQVDSARVVIY
jgi:hypothetical protein